MAFSAESKVLLVHPLPMCRLGLRHVITMDSDMRVCGEATTLAQARQCWTSKQPQIVVVDPEMERDEGFRFIEETMQLNPCIRCVAFGGRLGRARIEKAFKLGAVAVISHFDPGEAILQALYSANNGIKHMTPRVAEDFCSKMSEEGLSAAGIAFKALSTREKQIFRLIGKGLRIKEVAAEAGLSARTVESHESNIKKKLGLRANGELRRLAILFVERDPMGDKRFKEAPAQPLALASQPR